MIVTILNIALWVFSITCYIIYNLYKKNVQLEEMVSERDNKLASVSDIVAESNKMLKELDTIGAFKSDDEIGFFFQAVKQIQETLNQYTTK